VHAQKPIDLSLFNCHIASVKYLDEGQLKQGQIVFINYRDSEMPALQCSDVYLLNKTHENIKITSDSTIFYNVYDMKVSENNKYIALFMVSEGHPWIEIYDFQKLIQKKKTEMLADINPYPGNVSLLKWVKNDLLVESDINLCLKNENKDLNEETISEKNVNFLFNIETKKYKLKK
jgi:hypothetical protein